MVIIIIIIVIVVAAIWTAMENSANKKREIPEANAKTKQQQNMTKH